LFRPSFNAALGVSNTQERAVINTLLSLCASCVSAFIASHVLRRDKKFNMVDIQNSTLAGGVCMGACSDMLIQPGSAMGTGALAGVISVIGYIYIQPYLERKWALHDTCGVNNLHGMPSLIGGFASVIAASQAHLNGCCGTVGYGEQQLKHIFPSVFGDRLAVNQGAIQFAYMVTSVFIGLFGGLLAGHLATLRIFATRPDEHAHSPSSSSKSTAEIEKELFSDVGFWEVPQLETPYYFDHRGEIARDEESEASAASTTELAKKEEEVLGSSGTNTNESGEMIALRKQEHEQLLLNVQILETRINALSKRVGEQAEAMTQYLNNNNNNNNSASNNTTVGDREVIVHHEK
jgi:hypothetical protein